MLHLEVQNHVLVKVFVGKNEESHCIFAETLSQLLYCIFFIQNKNKKTCLLDLCGH